MQIYDLFFNWQYLLWFYLLNVVCSSIKTRGQNQYRPLDYYLINPSILNAYVPCCLMMSSIFTTSALITICSDFAS